MNAADTEPERLTILHVSEVHWGGVVTLIDHFLCEQRQSGHEAHLLAPPGPTSWTGAGYHRWAIDRRNPGSLRAAVDELQRSLAAVQPDVVHLHSFVAGLIGRAPRSPVQRRNVPVVYQPHAWSTELFRPSLLSRAVCTAELRASRRTDVIVANCEDEIEYGRRLGIDRPGRALGVAVDLDTFRPCDARGREDARAALGLGEERLVLVLGRLAYQKGQDLLLRAWEAAPLPRTLLALVGPGDPRPLARRAPTQWGKSIRWFGPTDDVRRWLWAADVLVLPSRYETVGLVVAEAMACGLPVVATAVHGARSTILDGDLPPSGAVAERGDMEQVLAATARRLEDDDLWKRESAAGRARAAAMFRPDTVAQSLEAAYREAVSIRTSRGVMA